ncbi:MAG: DedA family protein [Coriobacteriia bacterium]|nr:DedA family protein [Coriobacteriia bacterium]
MDLPATGIPVLDWFLALLGAYGYPITFGATVLENLFVIGSVTPGETIVMAAAFVSVQAENMNPATVWVISVVGTVTGSNVSYLLGRRGGRPALMRYGHRFHISEERIRAAEEYFDVHGSKTVLLSRFAAGIKNFVPMIAGASRMRLWVFEAYVLLGAVIYTSIMVGLGVLFGENFPRALGLAARLGYAGLALFVVVIVSAVIARRRYVARKLREAAEVAERAAEEVAEAVRGERGDDEGRKW